MAKELVRIPLVTSPDVENLRYLAVLSGAQMPFRPRILWVDGERIELDVPAALGIGDSYEYELPRRPRLCGFEVDTFTAPIRNGLTTERIERVPAPATIRVVQSSHPEVIEPGATRKILLDAGRPLRLVGLDLRGDVESFAVENVSIGVRSQGCMHGEVPAAMFQGRRFDFDVTYPGLLVSFQFRNFTRSPAVLDGDALFEEVE